MCLSCHGPINPTGRGKTTNPRALFCTDNGGLCRSAWHQSRAANRPLPWRCFEARAMHLYRRELEAARLYIGRRLKEEGHRWGQSG
jgi:hypothetical protein